MIGGRENEETKRENPYNCICYTWIAAKNRTPSLYRPECVMISVNGD